jgi:ABC-2 type transport system ATP-binding protein
MLAITNLSKKYGSHPVIHIPHLTIPDGTFWIEGGNGSGKTTLLKIIAGISPFEGNVSFNSIDLKKTPVLYRKEISYAEAEPQFPSSLTGLEIIRFIQKTRNADHAQVKGLVEYFNVENFINQAVGGYSSGMMKKLSILLAFIGSQKLILLDEPLITLDIAFIPLLLSTIKENQSKGISFLITSHQAFEANALNFNGKIIVDHQSAKLEMN